MIRDARSTDFDGVMRLYRQLHPDEQFRGTGLGKRIMAATLGPAMVSGDP